MQMMTCWDSEDDVPVEDFRADEQEQADTTSQQLYGEGKDQQGIPWERLQVGTHHTRTPAAVLQDPLSPAAPVLSSGCLSEALLSNTHY